jgi:hypothetical protein
MAERSHAGCRAMPRIARFLIECAGLAHLAGAEDWQLVAGWSAGSGAVGVILLLAALVFVLGRKIVASGVAAH